MAPTGDVDVDECLVEIRVDAPAWRDVEFEAVIRAAASATLREVAPKGGGLELSVLLTGDLAMTELNRTWRGKDGPTDVLSFPGDCQPSYATRLLGDIALSIDTLKADAARDDLPVTDHLAHLVVHGILHLTGYDHETDLEAAAMEKMEAKILDALGIANPYLREAPLHS